MARKTPTKQVNSIPANEFDLSKAREAIKDAARHNITPYAVKVSTEDGDVWFYFASSDIEQRLTEFTEDMSWHVVEVLNLKD